LRQRVGLIECISSIELEGSEIMGVIHLQHVVPLAGAAPRPGGRTLLLTGASGVVGQALLEKLRGHTLICLVRRTPVAGPQVECLRGDIAQPYLGLDRADFDNLACRIDGIVHAAAITDFAQSAEAIHQANVDGVRHVLELAAAARVPFYHISTAFVHPSVQGYGEQGAHAYQRSKRAAEELVRRSGLPATIIRPSIVIGDSRTGEIASFQGLHLIASLLLKGLLPLLPLAPQARLDFVPQDLVAGVIADLIERNHSGGEWWVTAGERAWTVRELLDLLLEQAQRLAGRPIARPRLVGRATVERLLRAAPPSGQARRLRRLAAQALDLSMYCIDQPLPSSLPELERQGGPLLPSIELTMQSNLSYWANATGALSRPMRGAAPAPTMTQPAHLAGPDTITERGAELCIA
jgi:nucleoside-diphosphate-sugar epimerase